MLNQIGIFKDFLKAFKETEAKSKNGAMEEEPITGTQQEMEVEHDGGRRESDIEVFSDLVQEQLKYMEARINYLGCIENVLKHERRQIEVSGT